MMSESSPDNLDRRQSLPISVIRSLSSPRKKSDASKSTIRSLKKSPLLSKKTIPVDAPATLNTSASTSRSKLTVTDSSTASCASLDAHLSQDELDITDSFASLSTTNGGSSEAAYEDAGAKDDSQGDRTKAAIDHLNRKIHKTIELIKHEQTGKEENVNEYLRLSANADAQQMQRIKMVFEKKNQKSTQNLRRLQAKLESYQRRVHEVETHGVTTSHKQAKNVLRDMGQGIRGVGANIRDGITGISGGVVDNMKVAKDIVVNKPKEIANRLLPFRKSTSADNIPRKTLEDGQGTIDEEKPGSGTLPAGFRLHSDDDDASSLTSGSGPSASQSSPRPKSQDLGPIVVVSETPQIDLQPILQEMHNAHEKQAELFERFKSGIKVDLSLLQRGLDEERDRFERLEEQIIDLTELHQHEVTNIKQELSSMEEKMEYQLEERTRDMQEMLESCQTRITKMELQQQQQQLISMEGIENSNARALITKLINVVLAVLAVLLVLVSTLASLTGPFLTTRLRILTTVLLFGCIAVIWQNWPWIESTGHYFVEQYRLWIPNL